MNKKVFITVLVALMLVLSVGTVLGSNSGGSGQDRWVYLETSGTDYTTSTNLTVPNEIKSNHTFSGDITHNITTSSVPTENWVNITINSTTFSSSNISLTTNETVSYSIEATNLTVEDNQTISISLENDDGKSDSWSGNIDVISDSEYAIRYSLLNTLLMAIPIILIMVVLRMIAGIMGGAMNDF